MKKSVVHKAGVFLLGFYLHACGQSTATVQVNVLTSPGNAGIKANIQSQMQNSGHRGVFFIVKELNSPIGTPDDFASGGATITYPGGDRGFDPTQTKFELKSGQLDQTRPYAVEMVAINANNQVTHMGLSDCYVDFLQPKLNIINICFRANDDATPCQGTQLFLQCK